MNDTRSMTSDFSIDAHVHVWNRSTDPQPWIDPRTMSAIDRDFSIDDLSAVLTATGIDAAIVVQSTNSIAETQRLLSEESDRVAGVVGWVDLASPVGDQLAKLAPLERRRLVGIRHLAHIDPDPEWLGRPEVGEGLTELGALGLSFDLVVRWWHLPLVCSIVTRHPEVQFVLDHLGGPPLGTPDIAACEASLLELAPLQNLAVKLSGVPADAGESGAIIDLYRPLLATAVEAFGPNRLLYGSDWPVVELAGGAVRWRDTVAELLSGLPQFERDAVFGGTARRVYRLGTGAA